MKQIVVQLTDGTSLTLEKAAQDQQIGYELEEKALRVWSNLFENSTDFRGTTYIYPITRVACVTITD